MRSEKEHVWLTKTGYKAEVIKYSMPIHITVGAITNAWRCGYVKVDNNHPLFNVEYGESHPCLNNMINDKTLVGKRSPIDILLYHHHKDDYDDIPVFIAFNVHGGITYSGSRYKNDWWFGFDCHHVDDTLAKCTLEYCINECESLAEQLALVEDYHEHTV